MNASIITIGNELLKGFTLDSNSSYIGSKLTDLGVRIVWKATPEDNFDEIIETINNKKLLTGNGKNYIQEYRRIFHKSKTRLNDFLKQI